MRTGHRAAWACLLAICTATATFAAEGDPGSEVDREVARSIAARWAAREEGGRTVTVVTSVGAPAAPSGWLCTLDPEGWVLVAGHRGVAPIKASGRGPAPRLGAAGGVLAAAQADLDVRAVGGRPDHPAWERWMSASIPAAVGEVGPLLSTSWRQSWPFNAECPDAGGAQTFVGCTALAVAQVLAYHQWPPRGVGVHGYAWDGDGSCGGDPAGAWLDAEYEDRYAWEAMPDQVGWDEPESVRSAVSELCYEIGVALEMDYGSCGSAAPSARIPGVLMDRFRYAEGAYETSRFRKTDAMWSDLLRTEIEAGRPVVYTTMIHTFVCDGWREVDGVVQIHMNYGWDGDDDGWYTLDEVETSLNPDTEKVVLGIAPDMTTALEEVEEPASEPPSAWSVGAPWPNPANPSVSLRVDAPMGGRLDAAVLDLRGRRVAVLAAETVPAGHYVLRWDGRTDRGRPAPDGPYLVRVRSGDVETVRRFSLVR